MNALDTSSKDFEIDLVNKLTQESIPDLPDVLLFKEVLEEMGLDLDPTPGGILINGIPAEEYLKTHSLFEFDGVDT